MTKPGGRGRWERVEAARRQAALALGRDPNQRDSFIEPPQSSSAPPLTPSPSAGPTVASRAIGVLSLGEAAARLNVSRSGLEAMVAAGAVHAVPTGFMLMIPTTEIGRLQSTRGKP